MTIPRRATSWAPAAPRRVIYLTVVATGVQDAVITLTFIQESESDIQGITKDAVERATAVFAKAA